MSRKPLHPLPPGSTIGIIGGGQLGRMTALAAARLSYRCHVFAPEPDSPGAQVSAEATVAPYDDTAAMKRFAAACDVVTFEFENIPNESVKQLEAQTVVRPGWQALAVAQDRLVEKDFINRVAPTTPYKRVASPAELAAAVADIGAPAVLKTATMGYDGKGQVLITPDTGAADAWAQMGADVGILEGFVDLEREISVIVARSPGGSWATFPPVENRHANHILDTTTAPARLPKKLREGAIETAHAIARELDLVGLLAVEMFVTRTQTLLVNEIAPRPHNSGHWTMDACATSQFEQFVRAVCGLPLGATDVLFDAVMTNLIGDDVHAWPHLLAEPGTRLHLYGKKEVRPGRKMGHVNRLYPKGSLKRV